MSKIKRFSRELWVGILGIVALFIIYFLINFFKGVNIFDDTDKYRIEFTNIGELTNSSPITVNGCKIGNVSKIEYDFNTSDKIYVTASINKGLRIPEGSYAEIRNKMMGGSTMNFVFGKGEGTIAPGSTMYGYINEGTMGEVGKMVPQIENMLPKLDSILGSVNSIVSNPAINNTLKNVDEVVVQLYYTCERLNNILEKDIPTAAGKLIEIEDDLLKVSSQLSEVDYLKLVASLEESLSNIQRITTALENGEGTMGKLMKDSTLYNRLNNTTDAAIQLLEDLKKNPKRYVHFSVFGRKEK
jgi:phospholipid/cholesterol/gamma-HCH transport system substrate-binding protein